MKNPIYDAELCKADFYYKLTVALEECGGANCPRSIERYQNMKLSAVVNILAQNGIRMTFSEEWHMEPKVFQTNENLSTQDNDDTTKQNKL